jgi:hypothetical protein
MKQNAYNNVNFPVGAAISRPHLRQNETHDIQNTHAYIPPNALWNEMINVCYMWDVRATSGRLYMDTWGDADVSRETYF